MGKTLKGILDNPRDFQDNNLQETHKDKNQICYKRPQSIDHISVVTYRESTKTKHQYLRHINDY